MSNALLAKGTIKVKNADGNLVSFLPTTLASCVKNTRNISVSQIVEELKEKTVDAESAGGIEIVHVEPTEETVSSYINNTLMAWYQDPELDGVKHMTVVVTSDSDDTVLKVGDRIRFNYILTNDGGD